MLRKMRPEIIASSSGMTEEESCSSSRTPVHEHRRRGSEREFSYTEETEIYIIPKQEKQHQEENRLIFKSTAWIIQLIAFQLNIIIEISGIISRIFNSCWSVVAEPVHRTVQAKQRATEAVSQNIAMISQVPPKVTEGGGIVLRKLGYGCLAATYVCSMLIVIMLFSLFIGLTFVTVWVEEPVIIRKPLYFDYTQPNPAAIVSLIPSSGAKTSGRRVIPAGHKFYVTVVLVMPESDHNRQIGMFQGQLRGNRITLTICPPCGEGVRGELSNHELKEKEVHGDEYWQLIVDTSICTLTCNVPPDVLVGGGMLERVDHIAGEHAYLYDPMVVATSTCIVVLSQRDEARLELARVMAELVSGSDKVLAKSSQPCMLPFRSAPVQLAKVFLMGLPLLMGILGETQTLVIHLLDYQEKNIPTESVKIILQPKAWTSGLPELYSADVDIRSQLPWMKEFTRNWKWTFFVWSTLAFYFLLVGLISCCCKQVLLLRSTTIGKTDNKQPNKDGQELHNEMTDSRMPKPGRRQSRGKLKHVSFAHESPTISLQHSSMTSTARHGEQGEKSEIVEESLTDEKNSTFSSTSLCTEVTAEHGC
ncbi:hypothetical protein KI387_025372 [Taxus chinensis]|uniref:Seipin n=1 Tax=Taxus chinensis TaxID=29808 RepID=A0AA38FT44_TAXCH|nr:hypothetical protein KI387_025372 [Taxus chinensis]